MIDKQENFSFETTLSGLGYLNLINKAKEKGYKITLFYIYLNSISLAIGRVAIRVRKGGHDIPKDVIERRYNKGLQNFSRYAAESDGWYIYDNSGSEYKLFAKRIKTQQEIINFELYSLITDND